FEFFIDQQKKPRSCTRIFCCGCLGCLPTWTRWICCFLFLCIIGLAIIAGVLVALFKVPVIQFNGPTDDPNGLAPFEQSLDSSSFIIRTGLKIGVVNPNIESAYFEAIKAVAYYPTSPDIPVGGGVVEKLKIDAQGTTNFTFPFHVQYDAAQDSDQRMLMDISSKCGLLGGPKQNIVILYDLTPTIRVLSVPFSFTIRDKVNLPCPIKDGQLHTPGH
ncbi:hypothetical protein J3Q64DRAFT_1855653, partial [Phycomyces blakesleeanus]